ncbi:MAG: MotA/TolQ/ExbB proton channel family protein [Planctomycetia bacterium]|nr:MotA/TolQ/ExbB proton channel family protein [Planctomycetia bacterium]
MNVNALASQLGDACYVFLVMNFLWGLYCAILAWRRAAQLKFPNERMQSEFLDDVKQCLERKDFSKAAQACEGHEYALPRLVSAVVGNINLSYSQLRQLASELVQQEVLADLEHRLSWIATVIKSGPLLGLFGTVLGMMAAFGRIGTGEKVQPSQIAHEISIALICTAMGLLTAIPFSYILATLSIRVRALQDSVTMGLNRVLEQVRAVTGKG